MKGGAPAKAALLWGARAELYREQARKLRLENDAVEKR